MRILLVGLPGSGKTTFLAALWHAVHTGTCGDSAAKLVEMTGDREYLNRIRDDWVRCRAPSRTPVGSSNMIEIKLSYGAEASAIVSIPDISGEAFARIWAERMWSEELANLVLEADALVLFIHPETLVEPTQIALANDLIAIVGPEDEPDYVDDVPIQEWEPRLAPTQVQLVEILQAVADRRQQSRFALCVVISAWDVVTAGEHISPTQWLSRYVPLLDQYVRARHSGDVFVFGLSAQGGGVTRSCARTPRI